MKVLVDAQLPRKIVGWLSSAGCDAIHTLDLPLQNRTSDDVLVSLADSDQRVLVTKDGDFVDSHLLRGQPARLLLIATGNISNQKLERLMTPLLSTIVAEFQIHSFLELNQAGLTIRG
jgi:predicted nuclease of predicted toxin-antitoxin system